MNNEQIAKVCHAAHNEYCQQLGQDGIEWEDKSKEHQQTVIDSVDKIRKGVITSPVQAHQNFVDRKRSDGWEYGDEYSVEDKINPRLVDFDHLSPQDRNKEIMFFSIVMTLR